MFLWGVLFVCGVLGVRKREREGERRERERKKRVRGCWEELFFFCFLSFFFLFVCEL